MGRSWFIACKQHSAALLTLAFWSAGCAASSGDMDSGEDESRAVSGGDSAGASGGSNPLGSGGGPLLDGGGGGMLASAGGAGGLGAGGQVGAGGTVGSGGLGSGGMLGSSRPEYCVYDVSQDELQVVTEYESTAKTGWYTDTWATPVTTAAGEVYFTYVTNDLKARVGKISDGVVQDLPLDDDHTVTDDGHNEYSIAVDKLGYVHVVGDMHNNGLRYWRSNAPGDISSFTAHFGDIPSEFSYYFFRADRHGELFLVARATALDVYYTVGGRGVGLYRYDANEQSWTTLGALPPDADATHPVIFWEDSGRDGTSYQMYKADVRFGPDNRLHFTVTANNDNAPNTHNFAVYAYSDDGGETFSIPGTGPLELPLRVDEGPGRADIVAGYDNADMGEHSTLFIDYSGAAGVAYSIDGSTFLRYQSTPGGSLGPPQEIKSGSCSRCLALWDEQGVLTLADDGTLRRARDFGDEFQSLSVGTVIKRWDLRALRDEGVYRGVHWDSGSGQFRVLRVEIDNPTACAP